MGVCLQASGMAAIQGMKGVVHRVQGRSELSRRTYEKGVTVCDLPD